MTTLHICRGLPGSGKSTFARAWVAEDPARRVRVNRDDTRTALHEPHAGKPTEEATTLVCHSTMRTMLRKDWDVICDDTNLNAGNVKRLLLIAKQCGADVEWHDFEIDVDEAKRRDYRRGSTVGPDVIDRFTKYLVKGALPPRPQLSAEQQAPAFAPYVAKPGTPKAVIVDIDGTLAHNYGHRSFYDYSPAAILADAVHKPIAQLVDEFHGNGYAIVLVSGRDEICKDATETWLLNNDLMFGPGQGWDAFPPLFMRMHGDSRDDGIVKLEIFDAFIRDHYDVRYVLDDRDRVVKAWRSIGLTVLQVADGDF